MNSQLRKSHSALAAALLGLGGIGACSALPSESEENLRESELRSSASGGSYPAARLAHAKDPLGGAGGKGGGTRPSRWDSAHIDDIEGPFVANPNQFTLVPYFEERIDALNQFDPTNHRFVSGSGDYYFVCASLASESGAEYEVDFFIDGVRENAVAVSYEGKAHGCRTVRLNAGQSLDLRVYSAGGVTFAKNSRWNSLDIFYANGQASLDNAASITMPGSAFTQMPYNTPIYGSAPGGSYSAPTPGWYRVCASMFGITQDAELDLFVNGNRDRGFAVPRHGISQGCYVRLLNTGDIVDVRAHHYGASSTMGPNQFWNWMTVDRVEASPRNSTADVTTFVAPSGVPTALPGSNVTIMSSPNKEYLICASLASFTGSFELDLYVNDALNKAFAWSNFGVATGCRSLQVNWGDRIEVRVLQQTGSPMTFNQNFYWNWVQGFLY